jgi:hypothetical protein
LSADDVLGDGDLLATAKELGRALQRNGYRPPPKDPTIRVGATMCSSDCWKANVKPTNSLRTNCEKMRMSRRSYAAAAAPRGASESKTLVDLERSHFLVLVQTNETQARLTHLRSTGAVLRN